ncbi:hypothetical protein SSX86_006555 [Deinandra increscens subsp. villosa]|uniref:Pentatricopeptide repeat-containing protein n=1 Tax=Deinandra increscens subsp. villosa TaxID=3103831 RepID=A0AAP0DF23_9ASTR
MAEWSKAPDSSSGLRERAWVQIPLLTFLFQSWKKSHMLLNKLKARKFVPDIYSFNLWVCQCASAFKIDEVRNILDEMIVDEAGSGEILARHVKLVNIILRWVNLSIQKSNLLWKVKRALHRDWITHDLLLLPYVVKDARAQALRQP